MKKPMKLEQKYKPANARGPGPGAEGKAKIKVAEKLAAKAAKSSDPYYGESTVFGLRDKGSRLLGEDYRRSIGAPAQEVRPGYSKGGMVNKPGSKRCK